MGGVLLRDADQLLADAGIAGEARLEFITSPGGRHEPAEEGPLVIYVSWPAGGNDAVTCLTVAPDATVGGLATLAAEVLGAELA